MSNVEVPTDENCWICRRTHVEIDAWFSERLPSSKQLNIWKYVGQLFVHPACPVCYDLITGLANDEVVPDEEEFVKWDDLRGAGFQIKIEKLDGDYK